MFHLSNSSLMNSFFVIHHCSHINHDCNSHTHDLLSHARNTYQFIISSQTTNSFTTHFNRDNIYVWLNQSLPLRKYFVSHLRETSLLVFSNWPFWLDAIHTINHGANMAVWSTQVLLLSKHLLSWMKETLILDLSNWSFWLGAIDAIKHGDKNLLLPFDWRRHGRLANSSDAIGVLVFLSWMKETLSRLYWIECFGWAPLTPENFCFCHFNMAVWLNWMFLLEEMFSLWIWEKPIIRLCRI